MFLRKEVLSNCGSLGMENFSLMKLFCALLLLSIVCPAAANISPDREAISAYLNNISRDDSELSVSTPQTATSGNESPQLFDVPISGSILGGTDTARSQYEEYTLLLITDRFGNVTGMCGSTLISANTVLTAAHCVRTPNRNYFLVPGFYSFNDNIKADDMIMASRVQIHPNYDPVTNDSDIAVLTLSESTNNSVAAVYQGGSDLEGENGTVIGTGALATSPNFIDAVTLQEVPAPITSNTACNDAYNRILGSRQPITENMMCAGFANDDRGTCTGDSGGPLLVNFGGTRTVVGTVSFGIFPCEFNRATQAYARTSTLSDFIESASPNTEFITGSVPVTPNFGPSNPALLPPMMLLLEDSQ